MASNKIDGHVLSLTELKKLFGFDEIHGLTNEVAQARVKEFGLNALPKKKSEVWRVYLAPLLNVLILIYLIVVLAYFFLALWTPQALFQALATFVVIGANFIVSVVQQYRSIKRINALHRLSAPVSKVVRDGTAKIIPAEDLVPGDTIILKTGDRVPADARVVETDFLQVNESILTGESEPIEKEVNADALPKNLSIAERTNMLFQGTYIQEGKAKAIVVNTGKLTEIG